MSDQLSRSELLALTSEIVAAHVSNNNVAVNELPTLIQQVFQALAVMDSEHQNATTRPKPAVPINKSVTDEYIVCLEDGKKLQMLKRYLKTAYGMTVEQYKERWSLPADYPVVAPKYAKRRSDIAKTTGLGTKGRRRKFTVVDGKEEQGVKPLAIVANNS
jgi:predicted transcriptional regulator